MNEQIIEIIKAFKHKKTHGYKTKALLCLIEQHHGYPLLNVLKAYMLGMILGFYSQ